MTTLPRLKLRHILGFASAALNGLVAVGFLLLAGPTDHPTLAAAAQSCTGTCVVADACLGSPTAPCDASLDTAQAADDQLLKHLAVAR